MHSANALQFLSNLFVRRTRIVLGIEETVSDDALAIDYIDRRLRNAGLDFGGVADAIAINYFMTLILEQGKIELARHLRGLGQQVFRIEMSIEADGEDLNVLFFAR
jgi:hypothetical protein